MTNVLIFISALGSALVGGIFFAFSTFVMAALGRLPAEQGIATMNHINVTVINPWFMAAFMGTGLVCLVVLVLTFLQGAESGSTFAIAAALLYIIGCVGLTLVFNVPLNDALAKTDPQSAAGAQLWATYLDRWTMWNHVRTVAPLLSSGLFIAALLRKS